jgi:hypothetical protein
MFPARSASLDKKISELERNLVAKTNIIDKAKVQSKFSNLIGKGKQEKVFLLDFLISRKQNN